MTAAEPLDPETTEPAEWPYDDAEYDGLDDGWEPTEWLGQDDDGSAEAGRYRRVRTIDVGEWL